MNKEEMLKVIYEKVDRKEENDIQEYLNDLNQWSEIKYSVYNILWDLAEHKIMIWTCDKLIEKWPNYFDDWITILDLWIEKELPIEEQSEQAISYVYNLLTK